MKNLNNMWNDKYDFKEKLAKNLKFNWNEMSEILLGLTLIYVICTEDEK